MSDSVSSVA